MSDQKYAIWRKKATKDPDLCRELEEMAGDEQLITECFYRDLEFGTGGLRGVIGAGTNRMNVYTVGKATQALASYVNSRTANGSVAIAYDSRVKSELFARTAASIFAANGIRAYIFGELEPTPMLSFAVRRLGCDAGVVLTASHNPANYNGYKAYGPDGCQLCLEAAKDVLSIMNGIDAFDDVKSIDFDRALEEGSIRIIGRELIDEYLDCVEVQRVEPRLDLSGLRVIYTPLHGAGNKPVREILARAGITRLTVVPDQEQPDGAFPTVPYPNPEFRQAFELALRLAQELHPDVLLATDPDCDRVGIAVPVDGQYRLFSGNEVGALLLGYILERRIANGTLPERPVAVKTIVTTELAEKLAHEYGVELRNVLTGFKFIGEQIGLLEDAGETDRFIFGFEESYGYLAGSYVRDKDAVVASLLICEMIAYYKSKGSSPQDALTELYDKYGCYLCSQLSFTCEGRAGMERISGIMKELRTSGQTHIANTQITRVTDYESSVELNMLTGEKTPVDLPRSNVLRFVLDDSSSVIVRPSGTEPKIKLYLSAAGADENAAVLRREALETAGRQMLGF